MSTPPPPLVTLVQLVRVREPKLLPILAVFLCLGLAHTYEYWEAWFERFHLLAGAATLVLVFLVSPRHHERPAPPVSESPADANSTVATDGGQDPPSTGSSEEPAPSWFAAQSQPRVP